MTDPIAALFSVAWGNVGLVELLWTLGGLAGVVICLTAIWRSERRSHHLGIADRYTRRWANRSILVRNGLLGVVLEIVFWVGVGAMLDPQSTNLTSTAAITGLVLWMMELAIITTVLYEEIVGQIIRHHLEPWND